MANLDPARRRRGGGRGGGFRELEQHVPIGAKDDRRGLVRGGAHVGARRARDQHAPVGKRVALHPADRAGGIAYLRPAFDADERFDRDVAPVHIERLRARGRRVVEHRRGFAGGAEIGRGRGQRHREHGEQRAGGAQHPRGPAVLGGDRFSSNW